MYICTRLLSTSLVTNLLTCTVKLVLIILLDICIWYLGEKSVQITDRDGQCCEVNWVCPKGKVCTCMYLYVSKQYDVHYHCTCCLNRLEQLLKGLPLHGLCIYRYSRVHRYALYKQCFSQNKSQQKLWNSPLYCMLLCWYLLQINYRVVQSFGRRKLQQIWWFMTYLTKFYLPVIFILSDLLWKAANLLMFFL